MNVTFPTSPVVLDVTARRIKYRSVATWPAEIDLGNLANETEETHDTREDAECALHTVHACGFYGQGKVFPIGTRIEEFYA